MEIRPGCDGHYKLRDQIAMLPTPRAEKHSPQSREDFTPNLAARINMIPTPRVQMAHGSCKSRTENPELARRECRLEDVIGAMLKTPSSVETEGGVMEIRPGCDGHYKLRDQIAMLPTPLTISDNPSAHNKTNGEWQLKINKAMAGVSRGLKLQPAFVEWMMGYPLGFTHVESPDSKPSATPLSRKSHTKSSKQSRKSKGE